MSMRRTSWRPWLALFALTACHRGEPLQILQATPTGQLVSAPGWVEVRFDRAIIDPDAPDPRPAGLEFRIDPPLPGELGFPTSSSLTYAFAGEVPPAREYTVRLRAGLRSADQKAVLKRTYSFSFISERNAATAIYRADAPTPGDTALPDKGDWVVTNLDLTDSLVVALRFPDSVERVRSLVQVLGEPMDGGEARPLDVALAFPQGETADRFVISPAGNWPKHTKLHVRIGAGLMVSGIPAGTLATQREEKLEAATYAPLAVVSGPECDMCRPPATLLFETTTPVPCEDILRHVRVEPAPDELRCAGQPSPTAVRIEPVPALAAYTKYTVTVEPGVVDRFGQELETGARFTFQTGDANPRFAHQLTFNVLERKLGEAHEEKVYRAAKLEVEGARLPFTKAWKIIATQGLADQVAWSQLPWWLHDDYGYYDGGDCYWDEEGGGEVCEHEERRRPGAAETSDVPLPNAVARELPADPNGWAVVRIGLDPFLQGKGGLVVVKSTPFDEEGRRLSNPVLRLLDVTDIGLSAKYSPGQLVVLAARLSNGKPVAGATVKVYRLDRREAAELGPPAATTVTDEAGVAVLTASEIARPGEDPSLQAKGLIVTATLGDDQAFVWSSFASGGRRASGQGPGLVGKIYTERGVYRPGETVYYRLVARKQVAGGFATPQGEVQIKVRRGGSWYGDAEGDEDEIFSTTASLSEYGTFSGQLTVPASARVSDYGITAFIDGQRISSSFKVAEFRRAEMKVTVNTDRSEYIRGDELQARVNADYLFGAPAAGLEARWTLRRTWGYFESKRFPQARFSDYDYHTWWDESSSYSEFVDEGTATLDDNGTFLLERKLEQAATHGKIEDLVVSATVNDASGQSVSARQTVHVHPADFHTGIIPHGYLKEKDKLFSYEVVAISPEDEPLAGVPLAVSMHQEYWYSVKRKGPGGRLYWDYKRETIAEDDVCHGRTDARGMLRCQYTPRKGGSVRLRVEGRDKKGRPVRASSWFWVTGDPDYYGGRSDRGNQVGIMAEQPEVEVGSMARLAITSPFQQALALVTVEREDILWREAMPIGSNAVVEIPIQASWVPNVYVSATVVRGRVTPEGELKPDPERDKPAYALGYFNLKVKPTRNVLAVDVATDRTRYEPAQTVTATVTTTAYNGQPAAAEVNLYAVDEGVLMLTGYKTPDLVPALFAERSYSVLALDTRMHVLGRRQFVTPVIKGEEDGGGGGEGESQELRKDFNPVAAWVGSLVTGPDGKATHTFQVPDTLTTYRLMAVAVTRGDKLGSGQSDFKVSKTLMMRQAMPRFARPGDRMQAGVVVNQLSGKDEEVTVALERIDENLFQVRGSRRLVRKVGAKETVPFRFDLEAADVEGQSEIVFDATMGAHRDRLQLVLPVERLQPRESRSVAGVLAPGSVTHTLALPDGARPLDLEVTMSGLPVASLEEKLRQLVSYPYGCLEQRTSKILPLIAVRELAGQLGMKSIPTDKIDGWVREWVSLVPKYRCADDGFDYYPGCASGSDPYLTAFALDGLVTARKLGYEVPDDAVKPAADYLGAKLASMSAGGSSWDRDSSGLAGALRVLAELGRGEAGFENTLFERRAQLPLFAKTDLTRAIYARAGARNQMVDTLLSEVLAGGISRDGTIRFQAADQERYWWAWDSDQRSTALVLRTLLEVEPTDARVPLIVRGLVDLDHGGSYYTTQGVTQSLLALAEAASRLVKMREKPVVTLRVGGTRLLSGKTVGATVEEARLTGAELGAGPYELALRNSGKGPLYFGGFLHYAFPATMRLPPEAHGFRVDRAYTDRNGKPVGTRVQVGDYVKVELTIWPDESGHMVVVDDPLPAGLEPVDTTLATSDTEMAKVMDAGGDGSWWRSRYRELRDNRTEWHFEHLYASRDYPLRLSYLTRAVTPGTFFAPGTTVERMYQPHIRGRGPARDLVVEPRD